VKANLPVLRTALTGVHLKMYCNHTPPRGSHLLRAVKGAEEGRGVVTGAAAVMAWGGMKKEKDGTRVSSKLRRGEEK